MKSRLQLSSPLRKLGLLVLSVAVLYSTDASAAKRTKRKNTRPITRPKYDATAEKIELFEGLKNGSLKVRMILEDSKKGRVLIENTTKKPLTVQLPKAVVGVQILKQPGGIGGQQGGYGGQQGGIGGQQGGQQPVGGGLGGQQGQQGLGQQGLGGQQGGGNNFFSIPPERIVAVPFHSVCLAHGKKEPYPRCKYRLVKVEDFTKNKTLRALIELIATNRINPQIAQAAAWHLTDNMSWRQLASKQRKRIGLRPVPYFYTSHVLQARNLVAYAAKKAEKDNKKSKPTTTPRRRIFSR